MEDPRITSMRKMLSRMKVIAHRPAMTFVPHARMRAVRRREGDCVQLGGGGGGGDEACAGEERGACRVRTIGGALDLNVA